MCGPKGESYGIGDKVPICLHFSNGKKIISEPKLDEYSAIMAEGSFAALNATTGISLQVQAGSGPVSVQIPYIQGELVAPLLNVVVVLDDGDVTEVLWDTSCDLCDEKCIKGEDEEVCAIKLCSAGSSDCDARVYVTWLGTDSEGGHLLSSGFRMSKFRKYSLYDSYESARSEF